MDFALTAEQDATAATKLPSLQVVRAIVEDAIFA